MPSHRQMVYLRETLESLTDLEEQTKLKPHKRTDFSKRGYEEVKRMGYLTPAEMYDKFFASVPRANTRKQAKRDHRMRALMAALYVTELRISELLSIDKEQVIVTEEAIEFKNVPITKRGDNWTLNKPLPLVGSMEPFSRIVLEYLETVKEGKLFPVNRNQAYYYMNKHGAWNHYFRHQRISHLAKSGLSTLAIQDLTGHKSVASLSPYVHGDWRDYKEQLLK